jgi:hypothetical protein
VQYSPFLEVDFLKSKKEVLVMPDSIRSFVQDVERRFEDTFHRAHIVAGVCNSPTLEQVKDLLEHAEKLTEKAKSTTEFANSIQLLGQAGERLAGAADAIDGVTKKGNEVAGDVSAACEISEAVAVLNDWNSPNSKTSSQDAAKAFDKLFGGAARYMEKLPFPANQYAQLLSAIAENSFFSRMQKTMDFTNDPNNPEGSQLLQLDRDGYK